MVVSITKTPAFSSFADKAAAVRQNNPEVYAAMTKLVEAGLNPKGIIFHKAGTFVVFDHGQVVIRTRPNLFYANGKGNESWKGEEKMIKEVLEKAGFTSAAWDAKIGNFTLSTRVE